MSDLLPERPASQEGGILVYSNCPIMQMRKLRQAQSGEFSSLRSQSKSGTECGGQEGMVAKSLHCGAKLLWYKAQLWHGPAVGSE